MTTQREYYILRPIGSFNKSDKYKKGGIGIEDEINGMMEMRSELEKEVGYVFSDVAYLRRALARLPRAEGILEGDIAENERMEFLGDAVLEAIVIEGLCEMYPHPGNEIEKIKMGLVSEPMLAVIAREIGLEKGPWATRRGLKAEIAADTVEALIGAIYLDGGYEAARQFIEKRILCHASESVRNELYKKPTERFREQALNRLHVNPTYRVEGKSKTKSSSQIVLGLYIGSEKVAEGEGTNRRIASWRAAMNGLKAMEWN